MNKILLLSITLISQISVWVLASADNLRPDYINIINSEDIIRIYDSKNPGCYVDVDEYIVLSSGTFRNMLSDIASDKLKSGLPLAQQFDIFKEILPILKCSYFKALLSLNYDQALSSDQFKKIVNKLKKYDINKLAAIILLANYLDIPILLRASEELFADRAFSQKGLNNFKRNIDQIELPPELSVAIGQIGLYKLQIPICKQVQILVHQCSVTSVSLSADGQSIFTGSADKCARLFELNNIREFSIKHDDIINAVSIRCDGQVILTGSSDKIARLSDIHGLELARFIHDESIRCVALADDCRTVVTGSNDYSVRVWDYYGNQLARLDHEDYINALAISADGQTIVTGSRDYTARIWNRAGIELYKLTYEDCVRSVDISADGQTIVVNLWDNNSYILDGNGQLLSTLSNNSPILMSAISADGENIVTAGLKDQTVTLWGRDGSIIARLRFDERIRSIAISGDGKTLAVALDNGLLYLYQVQSKPLRKFLSRDISLVQAQLLTSILLGLIPNPNSQQWSDVDNYIIDIYNSDNFPVNIKDESLYFFKHESVY